jgi:hypothetical protein
LLCIPPIFARQWLGKHGPAAMNTQATIEELLDSAFSLRPVKYQRKEGDFFFPELLAFYHHYIRMYFACSKKKYY